MVVLPPTGADGSVVVDVPVVPCRVVEVVLEVLVVEAWVTVVVEFFSRWESSSVVVVVVVDVVDVVLVELVGRGAVVVVDAASHFACRMRCLHAAGRRCDLIAVRATCAHPHPVRRADRRGGVQAGRRTP